MKSKFRFIAIIAMVVSIAILVIACPNDTVGRPTAWPIETTITITVTGIPSRYIGFEGNSGFERNVGAFWSADTSIMGDSAAFVFHGSSGMAYAVILNFWDGRASVQYRTSSRNINEGQNTIPFSYFFDNTLTITIFGIPSQYNGWVGLLWLGHGAQSNPRVADNSMTFAKIGSGWAGIHDLRLDIDYAGARAGYRISSKSIDDGSNTIPWSDFTSVPAIIVTGIPPQYTSSWGSINLRIPGTGWWSGFGSSQTHWSNDSASSIHWDADPGIYDVRLRLSENFMATVYQDFFALSRNIYAGSNTIPFSAFIRQ